MAPNRPRQTLADYVTIAISPVLIVTLVVSLAFFLIEVLNVGAFGGRLKWTLFWFIFAVVLITRLAILAGSGGRVGLYSLALGLVVFIALQAFVEIPSEHALSGFRWAINLGLMAVIWWSAHRLTWDCTFIDDDVTDSGEGLIQAAGLDRAAGPSETVEPSPEEAGRPKLRNKKPAAGILGWWDRFDSYREEERRKPHKPGVWVVYFSLAALPLYGLGQTLIPPHEEDRRQYAFWMMVLYVASGLGLLVTTTFLGLRRYLRQRRLQMPVAMTGMWLMVGGGLIVFLLVAGALLPRPHPEYSVLDLVRSGSTNREASQHAVLRDSPGKGEGARSTDPPERNPPGRPVSGKKGEQQGGSNNVKSDGDRSGKDGAGKQGKQDDESAKKGKNQADKKAPSNGSKAESSSGSSETRERTGDSKDPKSESQPDSSGTSPLSKVSAVFDKLGTVLKWIVFAVLAVAAVFLVLRSGLRWLANFTNWAKRLLEALEAWWRNLFGRRAARTEQFETVVQASGPPPRPFASFTNPFLDGSAERQSPAELVRYSFEALEAWARENSLERPPDETPIEFVQRVCREVPAMEMDARQLAGWYSLAAYAGSSLSPRCLDALRQFWERLEAVAAAPMSA